jgi:hypothetical protein
MSPRRTRTPVTIIASLLAASGLAGGSVLAANEVATPTAAQPASAPQIAAEHPDHMLGELIPGYEASDPSAPVVTEETLYASDRFWPYHVLLASAWTPKGSVKALPSGIPGVLIRVEPDKTARIDFGRDGLYRVPVSATDLVERANRVRTGDLVKPAPNMALAIGPRLASSSDPTPVPYRTSATQNPRGFLAVFADVRSADFPALAKALSELQGRGHVLTLLFPRNQGQDHWIREELRRLDWTVPFVYDHLAEGYTKSLIDDPTALPFVSLQTADGRLLFQSRWRPETLSDLRRAIEAAFPDDEPNAASRK